MPIITVQFIRDVVATPEQKRELIVALTDKFVEVLGEVVRPFVYCLIQETPQQEWGIAGVPMPDLAYLTSDQHAQVIGRSNDLMRDAIASMAAASQNGDLEPVARAEENAIADKVWRGELDSPTAPASANGLASGAGSSAAAAGSDRAPERRPGGTAEAHRELFERWFEELWNRKNYDVAFELVDPGFIAHGAGGQDVRQGPAGVIEMVKSWHAAMPDGRMTIDDIITDGELSTIRMTWEGTHTGPFGDIPASGSRVKVTSIGIDRVVDGRIAEGWGELDMLGMLRQMGAIPMPDAAEQEVETVRPQAPA